MKLTPTGRTRAAQLLMGATGLGIASLSSVYGQFQWPVAVAGALVAGSGLLYGSRGRSLVGQVIARAGSWAVLAPSSVALFFSLIKLHPPGLMTVGAVAATGSALLLARPMLHTAEAKKSFAPRVLRRWLLAASTSSIAISAYGFLLAGSDFITWRDDRMADLVVLALSAMLLASAVGTVRMRAWGALLSALSFGFAASAWPLLHHQYESAVFLGAVPGLMVLLGVLAARSGLVGEKTRVAPETERHLHTERDDVHVRVALYEPPEEEALVEQPAARRAVA